MELSGDIIPFINDNYFKPDDYINKKTEAEKYKVSLVDLFNEFKKNDLYINMTKEAKRTFNKSKFNEKMEKYFHLDFRADRKGTKYLFNYVMKIEEVKQIEIATEIGNFWELLGIWELFPNFQKIMATSR